jgi:hypothetical protein
MPAWAPVTGVEKPSPEISVALVGGGKVFGRPADEITSEPELVGH